MRGHQRAETLKPYSQKTSLSDHRTTALSNSMKLSHAVWGHPRQSGHGGETLSDAGKTCGQEEKGVTEDEMVR